jgi:alkyldihydroxyacetonephosphate synthase
VSAPVKIDRASLLALVEGTTTLGACEEALLAEGLTLGLDAIDEALDVGTWLARGAHGARDPWSDPADHLVAGLDATLRDGKTLSIRPAPRRAVGPDLIALVVGMEARYAAVQRAWLRVHPVSVPRPSSHPLVADRNPPLTDEERALLDSIEQALRA